MFWMKPQPDMSAPAELQEEEAPLPLVRQERQDRRTDEVQEQVRARTRREGSALRGRVGNEDQKRSKT
jgi:hypothetical protein